MRHRAEIRNINKTTRKGKLVLFEPDAGVCDALTMLLEGEGWSVTAAGCSEALFDSIERNRLTAVVSETRLPDCTPQEILAHCSKLSLPVVFTGHDLSLQGAVDLIRQGAVDFLDKPFPQSRLLDLLDRLSSRQNRIGSDEQSQ